MLPEIRTLLPSFDRYHEPFLGGGAVFFDLVSTGRSFSANLSDVNPHLVNVYTVVRDDVLSLVRLLRIHARKYRTGGSEYYYRIRREWDQGSPPERAAKFLMLNRTCYNGLFRLNSSGMFNVPHGRYSDPTICDEERLVSASAALKHAQTKIAVCDFEFSLRGARKGDFVYLDPPFDPLSKTARFVSYTENGFQGEEQERVARVFKSLDKRGCKVLLSNSDTPLIRNLYAEFSSTTLVKDVMRAINCNASSRGHHTELLIANYDLDVR